MVSTDQILDIAFPLSLPHSSQHFHVLQIENPQSKTFWEFCGDDNINNQIQCTDTVMKHKKAKNDSSTQC